MATAQKEKPMSTALEPGIYEGIPFEEYLAWDAVSNSRLSLFNRSPRCYKNGFAIEPKPYLQLGRLIHCGVLEESAFAQRYAICPDYASDPDNKTESGSPSKASTTKYVKAKVAEFTEQNCDSEIVPLEWYESTLAIVRELAANKDAHKTLNDPGYTELSIVWDHNGILCKARLDKTCERLGRITDLKSCQNIDKFPSSIVNYGYHRQMAHYVAGWYSLTGELFEPWLIAVESSQPHMVQAAALAPEALSVGQAERLALLDELRRCQRADDWPAKENPRQWNLPSWYGESEEITLTVGGKTVEL
jgi:hypothetical protein